MYDVMTIVFDVCVEAQPMASWVAQSVKGKNFDHKKKQELLQEVRKLFMQNEFIHPVSFFLLCSNIS